jgi:hypothetical protein
LGSIVVSTGLANCAPPSETDPAAQAVRTHQLRLVHLAQPREHARQLRLLLVVEAAHHGRAKLLAPDALERVGLHRRRRARWVELMRVAHNEQKVLGEVRHVRVLVRHELLRVSEAQKTRFGRLTFFSIVCRSIGLAISS